jgi:hypothetical protein
MSVPSVKQSSNQHSLANYANPFASSSPPDDNFFESDNQTSYRAAPFIKTKAEFASSLALGEGVSRAIALYDFNAVEVRIFLSHHEQLLTESRIGWRPFFL